MLRQTAKQLLKRVTANNYQTLNRIEINCERLLANVNYFQKQNPDQSIIPILKANAYGHGLVQIAEILNNADCAFLAVDGYFEAAQIRHISRHRILVMGYIKPLNVKLVDTKRCSFVVQDVAGLQAFGALKRRVKIHLELNTGMNRLGLQTEEIDNYLAVLKSYPSLELEGIMSHLADADNDLDNSFTKLQARRFDQLVEHVRSQGFEPQFVHLAQTAGSTKAQSRHANAFRPGIGLYGINPLSLSDKYYKQLSDLQPVLTLKSTIIKMYDLKRGDRVSYNGIFMASRNMRIGILPLGYYEGLPRELSNKGCVTSGNKQLPIVGRICMNHTMVDISQTDLKVGDEVLVISNDPTQPNSIQQATEIHGVFSYSWLANLLSAIRRTVAW